MAERHDAKAILKIARGLVREIQTMVDELWDPQSLRCCALLPYFHMRHPINRISHCLSLCTDRTSATKVQAVLEIDFSCCCGDQNHFHYHLPGKSSVILFTVIYLSWRLQWDPSERPCERVASPPHGHSEQIRELFNFHGILLLASVHQLELITDDEQNICMRIKASNFYYFAALICCKIHLLS